MRIQFLFLLVIFAVFNRFNDEVKHIKVIEKDSWIHITEAKRFESLLVSHVKKQTGNCHSTVCQC